MSTSTSARRTDPGTGPPPPAGAVPVSRSRAAAALCCVAGLVHLLVAREHVEVWALAAFFFITVSAGQLWLAQALWRGLNARLVPAAVLLTSGLVALYVLSRTIGLPIPAAGEVGLSESHHAGPQVPGGQGNGVPVLPGSGAGTAIATVGPLDLVCLVAQLGALALLVGLLPAGQRRSLGNLLLAVGLCGWVVWGLVHFT